MEIIAKEDRITILNHEEGTREERVSEDPLNEPTVIAANWEPVKVDGLPDIFCGNVASCLGWCFQDLSMQLLSVIFLLDAFLFLSCREPTKRLTEAVETQDFNVKLVLIGRRMGWALLI